MPDTGGGDGRAAARGTPRHELLGGALVALPIAGGSVVALLRAERRAVR